MSAHQPTGPIQAGGRVKRVPSRPSEIAHPGVGEGQTVGILEGGSGPFLVAPTVSSRRINETEGRGPALGGPGSDRFLNAALYSF